MVVTTMAQTIPLIPAEEHQRRLRRAQSNQAEIWCLLDNVLDPEVPALSLWDLGVLQDVSMDNNTVIVTLTPTYSGCPALGVMSEDIESALNAAGFNEVSIVTQLTPAWTTDWLSDHARRKLKGYGIAPPAETAGIRCPHCSAENVQQLSQFASTACKAMYRCGSCAEVFDYFKPI